MYSEARNAVQVIYILGSWLNAQNRQRQPAIKRLFGGREKVGGRRAIQRTREGHLIVD